MLDKEKLDAVIVCTPHNVHREQTVAALEHGLHVLVEKPIAVTARDAWADGRGSRTRQPHPDGRL